MRAASLVMLAALTASLCAAAPPRAIQERLGPDVTLYASFDMQQGLKFDEEIKIPPTAHGRRDWIQTGRADLYPRVDTSATGAPLLLQRALKPTPDGRLGQAVRLRQAGFRFASLLVFDAVGNLFPQRGTVGAWLRWKEKPPPHRVTGTVFMLTCMRLPGSYSGYMTLGFLRGHTCYLSVTDRFGVAHRITVSAASLKLKPGQWHHFAIAWDHMRGLKLFVDGKVRASNWGRDRWHARTNLDALSVGHRHRPSLERAFGGKGSWDPKTVLDIDEVAGFRRALTDGEVASLHADGRIEPAATPVPMKGEAVRHRRAMMGWGADDGLPEIQAAAASSRRPVLVREVEVRDAKATRIGTHTPIDGQWFSRWPLRYHSYSTATENLTLELARTEYYGMLRMVAPKFAGRVEARVLKKRGKRQYTKIVPLASVPFEANAFRRLKFLRPVPYRKITIVRESGTVNDAKLFNIYTGKERPKKRASLRPTRLMLGATKADTFAPPQGRRLGHYSAVTQFADDEDRTVVSLLPKATKAGDATLRAGRFLHLDAPPVSKPVTLSRIAVDWQVEGLDKPTRIWLGLWEPVLRERLLWEFDWLAVPKGEGAQRIWVQFDLPGLVLQPGQNLRLMVLTDRDLTIRTDGPSPSAVVTYATSDPAARQAYYEDQLGVMKDVFGQCSEPRRWILAGQPYNAFRNIAALLAQLESLGRLQPDDWRPAGVWRYMHAANKRMGIWEGYRQPTMYPATAKLPVFPGGSPEWAFWWREAYKELRSVPEWWIDQRQIANGEFGGGYGDDTDMVHEWANFHMMDDPDRKFADSSNRLADFCWTQNVDGLPYRPKDSDLHCYEDGVNIHGGTLLYSYGDPVYYNRLLVYGQHVDGHLTRVNAKGQRLFPTEMYGGLSGTRGRTRDSGFFFRMEPAMWLLWYNRHPEALRLTKEWMDTRLAYYPTKHVGGVPGTIRFEDGKDMGPMKSYMGLISLDGLDLLARITGEARYLKPIVDNLQKTAVGKHQRMHAFGPERFCLFARFDAVGKAPRWPKVVKQMREDAVSPYASPTRPEARAAMVEGLKAAVLGVRDMRGMFTWVEQSPDRIFVAYPRAAFYWMTLGGTARQRNVYPLPYHAVSYEGADENVARWVTEAGFDRLTVALYSFHKKPRTVTIRPWILDRGLYSVQRGIDTNGDLKMDAIASLSGKPVVLNRFDTPLTVTLTPGRVQVIEVRLKERLPDLFDRADVAVSRKDIVYLPAMSALRIPVHNIGRKAAENVNVLVERARDGRDLWQGRVGRIDWPANFAPKTVMLYTGRLELKGVTAIRVIVDPTRKIADFTRHNNSVVIPIPSP